MDKPRIDLTVMYDKFDRSPYPKNFENTFSHLAKAIEFDYSFRFKDEECLELDPNDRELFPENGLFYVHGNMLAEHVNFDLAHRISSQRPDLRFIVEMDSSANSGCFSSAESYQRYRESLTLDSSRLLESLDAIRDTKVIISTGGVGNFFGYPHSPYLQQYLTTLLRVRNNG